MEPKVPVFKSDDISSTKSKEQVNHFVNVKKSSPVSSIASTLKAPKDSEKKKALLARLKQARLKILLVLAAALVVILLTIFLPTFLQKQSIMRETDRLIEEAEKYIANYDSLDSEEEVESLEQLSVEEKIIAFLDSDKKYADEKKSIVLTTSLLKISAKRNDYTDTIQTLNSLLEEMTHESSKAEILMMLAESYYALENKVAARDYYKRAIGIDSRMKEIEFNQTYSSARLDMLIEFGGNSYE